MLRRIFDLVAHRHEDRGGSSVAFHPGLTDDPSDPRLGHGADPVGGVPQNEVYLVLSDEDRSRGFVRPLRLSYRHDVCGAVTTMGLLIAETYAAQPSFYGSTYCCACRGHFPIGATGEFSWEPDGSKVGT